MSAKGAAQAIMEVTKMIPQMIPTQGNSMPLYFAQALSPSAILALRRCRLSLDFCFHS